MGKYKVVDQDNFEAGMGEDLPKEDEVERDGYRSVQEIVEEMLVAGERLQAYRRGEFDIEEVEEFEDVEQMPKTRVAGYDIVDAQNDMKALNIKIDKLIKDSKDKKAKEAVVVEEKKE